MAYFLSLQASAGPEGICSEQGQEFGEEDEKREIQKRTAEKRHRQQVSSESSDDEEEWPCLVCGDNFINSQSKEVWKWEFGLETIDGRTRWEFEVGCTKYSNLITRLLLCVHCSCLLTV